MGGFFEKVGLVHGVPINRLAANTDDITTC